MTGEWTNESVIKRWGSMPREALDATAVDGGFAKRHLLNPVLLRMLGEVAGRRILDAGCGHGYFSRILADMGALVVGVEPGESLLRYALEKEHESEQGIRYVQADLCDLPELGGAFDVVVASMVLPAIPDWATAMQSCVAALKPGGIFVFSLNHPCFEHLWTSWRQHGDYRIREYLRPYEIVQRYASDFHRPLSSYINEVIRLGCRLREIAEPGLDPAVAAAGPEGSEAYVGLPNFLIVAAERS